MPWRITRQLLLILCGVVVLVLAIIVLILNRSAATDILAVIGVVGGVAIVITSLPPGNGNGKG